MFSAQYSTLHLGLRGFRWLPNNYKYIHLENKFHCRYYPTRFCWITSIDLSSSHSSELLSSRIHSNKKICPRKSNSIFVPFVSHQQWFLRYVCDQCVKGPYISNYLPVIYWMNKLFWHISCIRLRHSVISLIPMYLNIFRKPSTIFITNK